MYGEFYFIGVTLMDIKIGGHAQEVGARWGLLSIDADTGTKHYEQENRVNFEKQGHIYD